MYSPPADTLATTLTTIKSPNYNAFVNDVAADLNLARPIVSGGTGATSVASAQTALSLDNKVVYASKSGNYTAVATDNNADHRYTAAATVTLTAAATLGANWHHTIIADGGAVTIDPNGSETINGLATLVIPNGSSAEIICDGSNFFTVIKSSGWPTLGVYTLSAVSSFVLTDLGNYQFLKLKGRLSQSAAGFLITHFSTNNGSSYDTGANYFSSAVSSSSGSPTVSNVDISGAQGIVMTANSAADAGSVSAVETEIFDFNKASSAFGFSRGAPVIGGTRAAALLTIAHTPTTARNALRVSCTGGGTISGTIILEGMRG